MQPTIRANSPASGRRAPPVARRIRALPTARSTGTARSTRNRDGRGATIAVVVAERQPLLRAAWARLVDGLPEARCAGTTASIEELESLVARTGPCVVLLDVGMGGALVVARRLALAVRHNGHPATGVVLLDEFDSPSRRLQARRCGAAGYVTRQATVADLQALIAHAANPGRDSRRAMLPPTGNGDALSTVASIDPAAPLTPREREVLRCLAEGLSVKRCATLLKISANTVDNHKARIMRKLGLHKSVELARFAVRHGLVPA